MSPARGERRPVLLLVGPAALWIGLTYLVPGLLIAAYSFLGPRIGGGVEWTPTLDAYRELLGPDERASLYNNHITVLARSVAWATLATIATLVLSLPVSIFIAGRRRAAARNTLLVAVMIPFWTSMLVRTYALRFLLGNTGPMNRLLEGLGIEPLRILNTREAVIVGLIYTSLPFMILPLYASVVRVDHRVLEAGKDLGAGPAATFIRVFIPLIRPGIVVGATLTFVLSVSQYIVPTLLGSGKANMIANLVELHFGEAFNWPLGAATAVFFSLLTLIGLWIVVGRRDEAELV